MLDDILEPIREAYSGGAAKEDVAAISRHHRIQASPGYRAAAAYVYDALTCAGLEAAVEQYPADYQTRFWAAGSFQEWRADGATLHLVEPAGEARQLADYRELKLSLIQRSAPFSGELEVVLLEDGTKAADYEGLDVAGKLVLTNGAVPRVRELAVERRGAAGILFDGMAKAPPVREAMDLPDARQYTSFWWTGLPGEKQCFGFVLSPRQGAWLRDLLRKEEPVRVRAEVKTRFADGAIEVVTAAIPGSTAESVMLVSHLCHPQPSANDNASGAAANLEVARTLQRLIASGDLPRPRRTIRFLWMPEMTGSYAYLSRHEAEIPQLVAGLNLDMVGEDQAQTGSVLLIERPPDAAASFAVDLLERLREAVYSEARSYDGLHSYSLVRTATAGFGGGSDHYIFSDPAVGVPMPMLIQWPDKFYHTSTDTLDKVSAQSLAGNGSLAAAYAYFVAAAGEREATWLAHEMTARFQARLGQMAQDHVTAGKDPAGLERRVAYAVDRHAAALASLERLWAGAGEVTAPLLAAARAFAGQEVARAGAAATALGIAAAGEPADEPDEWEAKAAGLVPRRRYRGPGLTIGALARLSPAARDAWRTVLDGRSRSAHTATTLAEYWVDGRRTVLDIVELVEMETGIRDAELIGRYFELLHDLELVALST